MPNFHCSGTIYPGLRISTQSSEMLKKGVSALHHLVILSLNPVDYSLQFPPLIGWFFQGKSKDAFDRTGLGRFPGQSSLPAPEHLAPYLHLFWEGTVGGPWRPRSSWRCRQWVVSCVWVPRRLGLGMSRNRASGSLGSNLEDLGVLSLSSDFTVTGDMPKFSPE